MPCASENFTVLCLFSTKIYQITLSAPVKIKLQEINATAEGSRIEVACEEEIEYDIRIDVLVLEKHFGCNKFPCLKG